MQNIGIPMSATLAIGTKAFYTRIAQSSILACFLSFSLPRMQSYVSNYIFRLRKSKDIKPSSISEYESGSSYELTETVYLG